MIKKTILHVSSAFSGGIGGLREVCEVVSDIAMIVGLYEDKKYPDSNIKEEIYTITQKLIEKFIDKHKTLNCGELIQIFHANPLPSEYYQEQPCTLVVENGGTILYDYLEIK